MQETIVIRLDTFVIHWEPVQMCGRVQGCKHGKNKKKTESKCWMLGVKKLAPAQRTTRRSLPDAKLGAPNRNAQTAQRKQHA